MASPVQWTWVWASSRRWWRTGKPGVLQSTGSQRVRHHGATEQKEARDFNPWTQHIQIQNPTCPNLNLLNPPKSLPPPTFLFPFLFLPPKVSEGFFIGVLVYGVKLRGESKVGNIDLTVVTVLCLSKKCLCACLVAQSCQTLCDPHGL